jgi:hypothetical protein
LRLEIESGEQTEFILTVRGTKIRYDAMRRELHLADHTIPTALQSGKLRLTVLADRTSLTLCRPFGLDRRGFREMKCEVLIEVRRQPPKI